MNIPPAETIALQNDANQQAAIHYVRPRQYQWEIFEQAKQENVSLNMQAPCFLEAAARKKAHCQACLVHHVFASIGIRLQHGLRRDSLPARPVLTSLTAPKRNSLERQNVTQ